MNNKVFPSKEDYNQAIQEKKLVAVSSEFVMDLDTPVSVFYKLVGNNEGFILESVDTSHQQFGRYSFIGADAFIRLQVFKNRLMIFENGLMKCLNGSPIETLKQYLSQFKASETNLNLAEEKKNSYSFLPLASGGMVGYFNYEVAGTFDRVRGLELGEDELLGQFMICREMVVFDALKNSAQLIYLADNRLSYEAVLEKIQSLQKKLLRSIEIHTEKTHRKEPVDLLKKYQKAPQKVLDTIATIKEKILAGDIFQAVPSMRFEEKITKPAFLFYRRLRQVNPSPYMFYLNFDETKLVGASPERLIKVSDNVVYTYPIAGSRRRGKNELEDEELAKELACDEKEIAEHCMLVDLARNDLGRISFPGTVHVTKLRAIEKFSHVMHIVSEVTGTLAENVSSLDVLKAAFPAGTVSGAPKLRAMEIIHELENLRRKTYAGSVGYVDFAGNLDFCITLRTMRIEHNEQAYVQAGAGIVADSIPENEYREFLQKARALFEVIEEVENDDYFD